MITRKFGRRMDHRDSMIRNLATSIILYEKVATTTPKAKEIRSLVEQWINIGKDNGLTNYRRLLSEVQDVKAAKKLVEELGPRYKNISGGYVILTPTRLRLGDAAPMSLLELRGVGTGERTSEKQLVKSRKTVAEKVTAPRANPMNRSAAPASKQARSRARKPSKKGKK